MVLLAGHNPSIAYSYFAKRIGLFFETEYAFYQSGNSIVSFVPRLNTLVILFFRPYIHITDDPILFF